MKLETLSNLCFFASPTPSSVKKGGTLSIIFEGKGHLVLNGRHAFSLSDGVFKIPHALLKEGENTLSIASPEGSFSVESLTVKDGLVFPSGIRSEVYLPLLFKEVRRLKDALRAQAEEICVLKEKTKERTLFS